MASTPSLLAAIESIAAKIGCVPKPFMSGSQDADTGLRDGVTSVERHHIKALEREVKDLRQANEIL